MPSPNRHQLWILAAASIIFFTNLGTAALWDEDEPLYAACARGMLDRGDWVVPYYNGTMFPEKPPLIYWFMILGYHLFGVTELATRVWSALFGVGTALVTYRIGRALLNERAGFWAGLAMASTIIFTVSARAATVDSLLVFLTTTAIWLYVRDTPALARARTLDPTGEPAATPDSAAASDSCGAVPRRWITFLGIYACLGLAVLAKGPVGAVLPVAVLGLFVAIVQRGGGRASLPGVRESDFPAWRLSVLRGIARTLHPVNLFRAGWRLRPLTALVVVSAIALPWYVLVEMRSGGGFLSRFLGEQNIQRMFEPMQGHRGPFWYYLPAVCIGFFPWSVFFGPAVAETIRRLRGDAARRPVLVFLACWIGVFFVFWSVVTTKLPHYVLPIYPALAIVVGVLIDGWRAEPARFGRWWLRVAGAMLVVVGAGIAVGIAIASRYVLPGEETLGLPVGLMLAAGGLILLWQVHRQRWSRVMPIFAATSVAFLTAMFGFAAVKVDRHQNAKSMLAAIQADHPGGGQLLAYRFLRESTVFYAGEDIPLLNDAEAVRRALDEAEGPVYLLTHSLFEPEIEDVVPGGFREVTRQREFLRKGEVVVLAPRDSVSRVGGLQITKAREHEKAIVQDDEGGAERGGSPSIGAVQSTHPRR